MKFFFSEAQLAHNPRQYMVHGRIVSAFENADRATTLIGALEGAGLDRHAPPAADLAAIHAVHADHYVDFLRTAHAEFTALPNAGPEVLPNVHAYLGAAADYAPRPPPRPTGILGRAGWYIGDLSAVLAEGSYGAILASAAAAQAAADAVLTGDSAAFALCRPPGHHAYIDRGSGFCFLNNAAIAAERLRSRYSRVAILDFDTHHGDGTQAIFYRRADVLFGSVHTDPSAYYPHFAGYADETGAGAGEGFNLNLPLPFGAGDSEFVAANVRLIERARDFGAEAVVISAGWDAHHRDPLSKLTVTNEAYARIGALYGAMKRPAVIVQEGGYSLEAIGPALETFMREFRASAGI